MTVRVGVLSRLLYWRGCFGQTLVGPSLAWKFGKSLQRRKCHKSLSEVLSRLRGLFHGIGCTEGLAEVGPEIQEHSPLKHNRVSN